MLNKRGIWAIIARLLGFKFYDWTHKRYLRDENHVLNAFNSMLGKQYYNRNKYLIVITNQPDADRNGYKASDFDLVIEVISPLGIFDKRAVLIAKTLKERLRQNGYFRDQKLSNGTSNDSRHLCMILRSKVNR